MVKFPADSAFVLNQKYSEAKYAQVASADPFRIQIGERFRKQEFGHGILTLIASNPVTLLAIIPDYEQYRILRMYAYSDKMIACDVSYSLSKKQAHKQRKQEAVEQIVKPTETFEVMMNEHQTIRPLSHIAPFEDFEACCVNGFVFAQTYGVVGEDGDAPVMPAPAGLDWQRNIVPENDGLYVLDGGRVMQTWRAVFTHVAASKQIRDAGKLRFALTMAEDLLHMFRVNDLLHSQFAHPDYMYFTTDDVNGESIPIDGYFWEENVGYKFKHRDVLNGKNVTHWRRKIQRSVEDVEGVWIDPTMRVSLLSSKEFGNAFGTFLPPGMAGIDFSQGPIASINWFGSLTYQVRGRDGGVSEERQWYPSHHLPLSKEMILEAIRGFTKVE